MFKAFVCSSLLALSLVARAQDFEIPAQDNEFSNQVGVSDRWGGWTPPSIPIPHIPTPSKTVEVCGVGFGVSIALYFACNAQMGAAVSTCPVANAACTAAIGAAASLCALEVSEIKNAIDRCYGRQ